VDKKLLELAEVVMSTKKLEGPKGEQGLQGPKGEQGDRGLQGDKGLDGKDGVDGKDGKDGVDGVSVVDARIDFDGTLVITLSNGKEITAGDVVPEGVAKDVNIITSGNGTAKVVTDTLASLQAQIDAITGLDGELGTMAQQNDTAVDINGGAIDGTIVGAVTPAAGTFTTLSTGTLTATGQTSLGGVTDVESLRVTTTSGTSGNNNYVQISGGATSVAIQNWGTSSNIPMLFRTRGSGQYEFATGSSTGTVQFRVSHTSSAVNYVQVTGAATGSAPIISAQGSDTNTGLVVRSKGTGVLYLETVGAADVRLQPRGIRSFSVNGVTSGVNFGYVTGAVAGSAPIFGVDGSDTNIDLTLTPKGTGLVKFGTYTAGAPAATGYISVKSAAGVTYKILVST
jgi:hypothetical protein